MNHKFAVLGSGNGARAFCAQIAAKGYDVVMWEPLEATEDYKRLREEKKMHLKGDINIEGTLSGVTMDIEEAMDGAKVLFVVVPSFAHEPIFRKMLPHLKDGQHIVVVPGNYAGFRFRKIMKEEGIDVKVSISETASMPYACRISSYDTVMIFKKKFKLQMATSPVSDTEEVHRIVQDIFEGYVEYIPADNLLAIDLDNINFTLHPFPVLLNYGAIEKNPKGFRHYMDGITPEIAKIMEKLEKERIAIGKALGVHLIGALDQLKMFYGENEAHTYYEYVQSPESPYVDLVGHNIKGRYLTEDVPGVLVPAYLLAQKAGYDATTVKLAIDLASKLHDVDYLKNGTTLETLGIADLSIEEILNI
ncbi:MAG: NAD/NADP octopine/nopaline dehydrogenase family protein [Aminobacterium sp.]|jgi:opine dehydrogenase|nr:MULTISPECIES: NAD/NADP octopine/nopaline dehydrogenase family protein [unclassified Aminobacterium]MDD2206909.1 NAD/NADP octopine/nopaline dehydrogenase family protein [Aminobacterium sp.]MDD3425551.1 NAD/NADP octopine/nopaline dehydrogenase family protein [Aminobacterium sp.]MDD3708447.1 NAD/NADP octopine/nopaline dehydrogenase family protein [Aminobacterium sp.]MDD4229612.1 NAD/NADP octopine/nopaline dehydrogenase family protein [Aminobacterium sp.]MDD4550970.1 NAD/NADP octopine/nopaline 